METQGQPKEYTTDRTWDKLLARFVVCYYSTWKSVSITVNVGSTTHTQTTKDQNEYTKLEGGMVYINNTLNNHRYYIIWTHRLLFLPFPPPDFLVFSFPFFAVMFSVLFLVPVVLLSVPPPVLSFGWRLVRCSLHGQLFLIGTQNSGRLLQVCRRIGFDRQAAQGSDEQHDPTRNLFKTEIDQFVLRKIIEWICSDLLRKISCWYFLGK